MKVNLFIADEFDDAIYKKAMLQQTTRLMILSLWVYSSLSIL